jgi:hypothetical protein
MCEGNRRRVEIFERQQRNDGLRNTVNVDGVGAVVVVSWRSVLSDEVSAVKGIASPNARIELGCLRIKGKGAQRTEVIARVEIVDPGL